MVSQERLTQCIDPNQNEIHHEQDQPVLGKAIPRAAAQFEGPKTKRAWGLMSRPITLTTSQGFWPCLLTVVHVAEIILFAGSGGMCSRLIAFSQP